MGRNYKPVLPCLKGRKQHYFGSIRYGHITLEPRDVCIHCGWNRRTRKYVGKRR